MAAKRGSKMTVREAREALGVSATKMAQLIKEGALGEATQDPLDKRSKLVDRAKVEALKARSQRKGVAGDQA